MLVDREGDGESIGGSARQPRKSDSPHGRIPRKYGAVAALLGAALLSAAGATAATATGSLPGLVTPGPWVGFGLSAVRVVLDVAAVTTAGFSLLPKLLDSGPPSHTEPILSTARRISVLAALLWMLFALLLVVLQVAELNPGRPVTTPMAIDYVTKVPAGLGVLLSAGGGLACAVLGLLAVRYGESVPAGLRFVTAMLGLLPLPLTGHATDHDFSAISIELHVLAAATWTGGLVAVVVCVAPHRGLLTDALPRYSRLATLSLVVVGVSGAFDGMAELVTTPGVGIDGLLSTTYGRIVVVKMLCVVLLAALGGHIRFRLMPRISRQRHTVLIGWVTAEVTVMGLAYGLGAVLARAPVA